MRLLVLGFAVACGGQPDESCGHSFYADTDGDGHGVPEATQSGCVAPPGYETTHDDCDDRNSAIHPGADEACDGIDNDCDGEADPFDPWYVDLDRDGYGPDAEPLCGTPSFPSAAVSGDCDDENAAAHPGVDEICNGIDDDCEGTVDVDPIDGSISYTDADGDGYGDDATAYTACDVPTTSVLIGGDCDDDHDAVRPGATEICNEIDDDCDTLVDDEDPDLDMPPQYADEDGDGFGDPATGVRACTSIPGRTLDAGDCDDTRSSVNPGTWETCNGSDDDCDGLTDDDDSFAYGRDPFYVDADGDGLGDAATGVFSCVAPSGYVANADDCDDSDPAVGGATYLAFDGDGDGYGGVLALRCELPGWVSAYDDCDDGDATIHPGAREVCGNAVDENCNGNLDDCRIAVDESDLVLLGPAGASAFAPWRVGTGDLNGDGVADLVASAFGDDDGVSVVFGPESGEHSADDADLYFSGSSLSLDMELAVGDADGDGQDDLLLGATGGDVAYLFLGPTTSGVDVTAPHATLQNMVGDPTAIAIVPDHDGDATPDLVASTIEFGRDVEGTVYVVSGNTTGSLHLRSDATYVYYDAPGDRDELGASATPIVDATGDGIAELAIGAPGSDSHTVWILEGGAEPGRYSVTSTFASMTSEPSDGFGTTVASTDYEGDGYGDVFVSSGEHAGKMYEFSGPFTTALDTGDADSLWINDSNLGRSIAVGDLDEDGWPDLLLSGGPGAYLQLAATFDPRDRHVGAATLPTFVASGSEAFVTLGLLPDWTGDDRPEVVFGATDRVDVVFSENMYY